MEGRFHANQILPGIERTGILVLNRRLRSRRRTYPDRTPFDPHGPGRSGQRIQLQWILIWAHFQNCREHYNAAFDELIWERFILPLAMNRSLPQQGNPKIPRLVDELALPYHYDTTSNKWQRSPFPQTGVNAGAGMISTVVDIGKFDAAINQYRLISPEDFEEATTPFECITGKKAPYGLGWFVQETDYGKVIWHTGWQPEAYSGLYLKWPAQNLTIVLLANTEGLSAPFYPELNDDILASDFARLFLEAFGKGF